MTEKKIIYLKDLDAESLLTHPEEEVVIPSDASFRTWLYSWLLIQPFLEIFKNI